MEKLAPSVGDEHQIHDVRKSIRDPQYEENGLTERDQQILRPPELAEYLDQLGFGADGPEDIFVSDRQIIVDPSSVMRGEVLYVPAWM